jgi:multidrug efflux pump subunit AcrA (membrane-fusion protein)
MFLGRVVLPGLGLLLAVVLAWQAVRNVTAGGTPELTRSETSAGAAGPDAAPPVATPPAASGTITAEGRVVAYPGALVTVGTEVLGTIITMPVREKSAVRKGDLLVELRSDETRALLRKANVALADAEASVRAEQDRLQRELRMPTFAGPTTGERHDMAGALARRDMARAEVECLEAALARYRILAPIAGVVVARHAHPGETVGPAAQLLTIADLSQLRVEAEIDEFDIPRVSLGALAVIAAEGARGRRFRGIVVEVADAVVARQTRPEDPGRPSDTRVLPVWISYREPTNLRLGQRVEIEITTARDR